MFKRYRFEWANKKREMQALDFFVHSRARRRGGFLHEACVFGVLPRLDDVNGQFGEYRANEEKLMANRRCRMSFCNRTWEFWPGQDCLKKLWDKVAALKFVDMSEVCPTNPFDNENEPWHEDLWEPDDLFKRFTRR